MSFEDTIDTYRARDASDALERKQRLAARQSEITELKKLGYAVTTFNHGYQVDIRWVSYWPSTGKWRNNQRKRGGQLADGESLLELVQREVGQAGPARAKALTGGLK